MPIIRMEILKGRSQEVKKALAKEVTEVASRHLQSDPAHIYVIFEEVEPADWAVGGTFFSDMGKGDKA